MAKGKFRVVAEDVTVAGHRKGDEPFSFPAGDYNIEALIAAGVIEPADDGEKGNK